MKYLMVLLMVGVMALPLEFGSHKCPEDGCHLIWQTTEYCQGMKCRAVKIYKCPCCGKLWKVYE